MLPYTASLSLSWLSLSRSAAFSVPNYFTIFSLGAFQVVSVSGLQNAGDGQAAPSASPDITGRADLLVSATGELNKICEVQEHLWSCRQEER